MKVKTFFKKHSKIINIYDDIKLDLLNLSPYISISKFNKKGLKIDIIKPTPAHLIDDFLNKIDKLNYWFDIFEQTLIVYKSGL